jgi:sugar phosphate isomerase/epimerase
MIDRLLLSAGRANLQDCIKLAVEYGIGIEVMAFAFPDVLDGEWRAEMNKYKQWLRPIEGPITLHGPFMDMVSGSPDPRINAVCVARYSHAIRVAAELGAQQVVFHANFIGSLHNRFYRDGWHQRNVDFWSPLAEYAKDHGVYIALENMWEFDPTIIGDLLTEINHPYLRACLDVGHAHLFSDPTYNWDYWLEIMEPWLIEFHMNNNNGVLDEHHGFDWDHGVLDYHALLPKMVAMFPYAKMVLEMDKVRDMADSLYYFTREMIRD